MIRAGRNSYYPVLVAALLHLEATPAIPSARVAKAPESQDVLGSRESTKGSGDSSEETLDEGTQSDQPCCERVFRALAREQRFHRKFV